MLRIEDDVEGNDNTDQQADDGSNEEVYFAGFPESEDTDDGPEPKTEL